MKIRLAYLHDPVGGIEVCEAFDVDRLPRVGEHVLLPDAFRTKIQPNSPVPALRYRVVSIDHHWHRPFGPAECSVYIGSIEPDSYFYTPESL